MAEIGPVGDVGAVVDAKADGDDQVDAGDGVDGQAPGKNRIRVVYLCNQFSEFNFLPR
jgi:hypothetical protein